MKSHILFPFLARVARTPGNVLRAIAFWWRHGPISKEQAERIDRLCYPKKYLVHVNGPEKP